MKKILCTIIGIAFLFPMIAYCQEVDAYGLNSIVITRSEYFKKDGKQVQVSVIKRLDDNDMGFDSLITITYQLTPNIILKSKCAIEEGDSTNWHYIGSTYNSDGNLILEIDSSKGFGLLKRLDNIYDNTRIIKTTEQYWFSNLSSENYGQVSTDIKKIIGTSYFYENPNSPELISSQIEVTQKFNDEGSESDTIKNIFQYDSLGNNTKRFQTINQDTTWVYSTSFDRSNREILTIMESQDTTHEITIFMKRYDRKGNISLEINDMIGTTIYRKFLYNSKNQVIEETERYLY